MESFDNYSLFIVAASFSYSPWNSLGTVCFSLSPTGVLFKDFQDDEKS